jgi:hypothetical protein
MIGRDPLARNRVARPAWTSTFAAGEDEEFAPSTHRWKSWREALIDEIIGLLKRSGDQSLSIL